MDCYLSVTRPATRHFDNSTSRREEHVPRAWMCDHTERPPTGRHSPRRRQLDESWPACMCDRNSTPYRGYVLSISANEIDKKEGKERGRGETGGEGNTVADGLRLIGTHGVH